MTTIAYREPSGDVVMKADNFAIRFMTKFGAAPLQIFEEGQPMLTNDFAGSGVQLNWEVGQDPTQASANGLDPNPIALFENPTTIKYNYYARELLLNGAGEYRIAMFPPDFWLSHDPIDDKVIPNLVGSQEWATKYNPAGLPFWGLGTSSRVAFKGNKAFPIGIFAIGNEMLPGSFRQYPEGRFAAKVTVGLKFAGSGAAGGIIFKTNFNELQSVQNLVAVDHVRFTVNTSTWYLLRGNTTIAKGNLSSSARSKVKSEQGLELEVRTNNVNLNYIECYIDGGRVYYNTISGLDLTGENAGLYAICSSPANYVMFDHRQFFDVSAEAAITYTALPGGKIRVKSDIVRAGGAENVCQLFYRAGMQHFMNASTFGQDRRCYTEDFNGVKIAQEGLFQLANYKAFFVGNTAGLGLKAEPKEFLIDGRDAKCSGAHMLMQTHAFNDEFYMGFNAFPVGGMGLVKTISMTIDYSTRL